MPKPNAIFNVRRIVLTDDTGLSQLLVELDIDCDVCGKTQGVIHGHHLRTLQLALDMCITEYPELCGTAGEVKEVLRYQGVSDPKKARLN
jgi:hypothetical protein